MQKNYLEIKIQDKIAWIKINREEKLNALNISMLEEIRENLIDLGKNKNVLVLVIIGSGDKAFVAGADIAEFSKYDKNKGLELAKKGQKNVLDLIENFPKPIIAAINGYALGGGLELAMACHMRVAVNTAKMGLPEVSLGLIPGYGGTQRLTKLVGKTNAMEMILSGEMIDSQKALNLRLVNKVVERNNLFSSITELAKKIMRNSPNAIANAITSINAAQKNVEGFEIEKEKFSECFESKDFKEGVSAFLNKRKPSF
ncbi:MAG: enoyl-CoA hydratase [Flavobacteriaceae bacterium]|nr:enoyl-CoA hydratase [Flavobacteriaceae bacterium]